METHVIDPRGAAPEPAGENVEAILAILDQHYPEAQCTLSFANPLQLLVATILSAQCTDQRVNLVTPELFTKYQSAKAFAEADPRELEEAIKSTGFFRNKAKNIIDCCRRLVTEHAGQVPNSLEALVRLPGVGRKTANVILGNAFQVPGMVVDTHVARVSKRLGWTREDKPEKIERDLMRLIPANRWTLLAHQLIHHGRQVCSARNPKCGVCPLRELCAYARENPPS